MDTSVALGIAVLAIPLILFGTIFLRRNRAVFYFYIALVAVALGYLTTTGAVTDIGNRAMATMFSLSPSTPASAPGSPPPSEYPSK